MKFGKPKFALDNALLFCIMKVSEGEVDPMSKEEVSRIFSENLNRLLKEKDMQQSELARRVGTGAATVNDWVKGRSMPRTPALQKIAAVFGCGMSDLL